MHYAPCAMRSTLRPFAAGAKHRFLHRFVVLVRVWQRLPGTDTARELGKIALVAWDVLDRHRLPAGLVRCARLAQAEANRRRFERLQHDAALRAADLELPAWKRVRFVCRALDRRDRMLEREHCEGVVREAVV